MCLQKFKNPQKDILSFLTLTFWNRISILRYYEKDIFMENCTQKYRAYSLFDLHLCVRNVAKGKQCSTRDQRTSDAHWQRQTLGISSCRWNKLYTVPVDWFLLRHFYTQRIPNKISSLESRITIFSSEVNAWTLVVLFKESFTPYVLYVCIPQDHQVSDAWVRRFGTHHREVHSASLRVRLPHGAGEPGSHRAEERQGRRAPDRHRQRHQTAVRTRIWAGTEEVSILVY